MSSFFLTVAKLPGQLSSFMRHPVNLKMFNKWRAMFSEQVPKWR